MSELVLFVLAGTLGGAVNAAAGGAKLFVFPLLLASGLSPLAANITGTVALWPAQASAAVAYKAELWEARAGLVRRALIAAAGAFAGALTLVLGSEAAFVRVVPFVLALAVAAIIAGKGAAAALQRLVPTERLGAVSGLLLFGCGFYGGYFGAGLGFMLLATLTASGFGDMQVANGQKNLLAFLINSTAVVPLALSGYADWVAVVCVLAGGLVGGYYGGRFIRYVPERSLRIGVAVLGVVLTLSFLAG